MSRDLRHSAEGSTWTKKNHKYIRKEGNRYIYPEDVNKVGINKNRTARDIISDKGIKKVEASPYGSDKSDYTRREYTIDKGNVRTTYNKGFRAKESSLGKTGLEAIANPYNYDHKTYKSVPNNPGARGTRTQQAKNSTYPNKAVDRMLRYNKVKNSPVSNQSSPDYKKLSQQHANRQAAASGKVVNPSYTLRDEKGTKIATLNSKDKVQSPTANDYKQYSKERSNETNRANSGSGARNQEYAKAQNARQALNRQGLKTKGQDYAKRMNDYEWVDANEYRGDRPSTRAKRQLAMYRQERGYFTEGGRGGKSIATKESAQYTDDFDKSVGRRRYANSAKEENEEALKKASRSSKTHGYYTVKNGETQYVPSDEITMKKQTKVEKVAENASNKAKDAINKAKPKVKSLANSAENKAKEVGSAASNKAKEVGSEAGNKAKELGSSAKSGVSKAGSKEKGKALIEKAKNSLSKKKKK